MKYSIVFSSSFKTDAKKLNKDDKELVISVINKLAAAEILDPKYCDHQLSGKLKDYRDCHVKPDLVLIYKLDNCNLILTAVRISSHSNLFKK